MKTVTQSALEAHFAPFRENIVGFGQKIKTPYGEKPLIYADWTASGRLYGPIEDKLSREIGPYLANTHTETSSTGKMMTMAYHEAREIIKRHVNAGKDDVLIATGTGMTGAVSKFQRILGLKYPEQLRNFLSVPEEDRPVVFVTHMEHHSNQTSWLETLAHVVVVPGNAEGEVCLEEFEKQILEYKDRKYKIASVTACSNVTGIETPFHDLARLIHKYNGLCFVDFACSGPYVEINMHPEDPEAYLDAIFFSPHKFLGGPGTPGILVFNSKLYHNQIPDHPGGGTVVWTNPWGGHQYIDDIEEREDGGTPGFMQTIKAALAIRLKEEMGIERMRLREEELVARTFDALQAVPNLRVLAGDSRHRLGVFSFVIEGCHFNLGVQLLNDRFGIQVRGGCSCAGTYGHYLFNLDVDSSNSILQQVLGGELIVKPGWIRLSVHPTTTNEELEYILDAIRQVAENHEEWGRDYEYDKRTNMYRHRTVSSVEKDEVHRWFNQP